MRLIDADAERSDVWGNSTTPLNEWDTMGVLMMLDRQPTIDAVPVVRCKDCRNYKRNPYSQEEDKLCMCWSDWIPTEPDDFCSYGERKEGAGE